MKYKFYYCDNPYSINFFNQSNSFKNQIEVPFSKTFCEFFSQNFEDLFVEATGIKPSMKVGITIPNRDDSPLLYEQGIISKLNPVLWIQPDYYDDISFCWKSKTGNIVKPWDEHFDESDLDCWLENLKPSEYWNAVATEKKSHPFQLANLPFQLVVYDFGIEMELRLFLDAGTNAEAIKLTITETIANYNDISEANERKNGVVHNHSFSQENTVLTLRIDTGSATIAIIKTLLKAIKKHGGIGLVEVDI